jgi:hypothetical protein
MNTIERNAKISPQIRMTFPMIRLDPSAAKIMAMLNPRMKRPKTRVLVLEDAIFWEKYFIDASGTKMNGARNTIAMIPMMMHINDNSLMRLSPLSWVTKDKEYFKLSKRSMFTYLNATYIRNLSLSGKKVKSFFENAVFF